jgi:hypothetical protein
VSSDWALERGLLSMWLLLICKEESERVGGRDTLPQALGFFQACQFKGEDAFSRTLKVGSVSVGFLNCQKGKRRG